MKRMGRKGKERKSSKINKGKKRKSSKINTGKEMKERKMKEKEEGMKKDKRIGIERI